MKASLLMRKRKEKEFISDIMEMFIKENLKITYLKVKVLLNTWVKALIKEMFMKENLKMTKQQAKEFISSQMEIFMKVSFKMAYLKDKDACIII